MASHRSYFKLQFLMLKHLTRAAIESAILQVIYFLHIAYFGCAFNHLN
jgi:hypothetical protein